MIMKKISLLLFAGLLTIPACSGGSSSSKEDKKLIEKHANVYRTVLNDSEAQQLGIRQLSYYKIGEVDYCVPEKEELIPYVSVEQYSKFYTPLLAEKAKSVLEESEEKITWRMYVSGIAIFAFDFTYSTQVITYAGSLSSALKTTQSVDSSSLLEGLKMQTDILNKGEVIVSTSIDTKGFDLDPIKKDNNYYIPLGLLDTVISKLSGVAIYNAFEEFYIASNSNINALSSTKFYESIEDSGENWSTPLDRAKNNALENIDKRVVIINHGIYPLMPLYLREHNRNLLSFFFEYFYGLKYVREIHSMKDYFKNSSLWEDLVDEDPLIRGNAFAKLIGGLSDGHTSTRTYNDYVWGETNQRYYDPMWVERLKLRKDLIEARKEAYIKYDYEHANSDEERNAIQEEGYEPDNYAIRYSDDGTLAFFDFQEFIFSMDKEDPEQYKKDTFTYFYRQFKNLKNGVKNVVVDMSSNGGGIVISLMKILALISKENTATIGFFQQAINAQQQYTISIDANGDGKYDKDDVFGDDYNIYLLTSPFSFSCGNAYPFLAQKQGFATILGERSGGGECIVETVLLPSGQYIGHSSLTRIGYYQPVYKGEEIDHYLFEGAEEGAPVEERYKVNYFNYFNFNYLASMLNASE